MFWIGLERILLEFCVFGMNERVAEAAEFVFAVVEEDIGGLVLGNVDVMPETFEDITGTLLLAVALGGYVLVEGFDWVCSFEATSKTFWGT